MASDHSRVERQRAPAHAAPAGPQAPIAPRRRSCPPAFRFAASRIRGFATSRTPQNRADVARDAAARFGVEMTQIYWTLGHYDLVVTIEAPDDESATAFALAVASGGNMRMKTLRAFSKNELAPIIGKLGRQHATKGRHLAGFPMQGRLFRLDSPNPFVAGRALALASPLPVTTPSARSRGRGGQARSARYAPARAYAASERRCQPLGGSAGVGLLAARDRPASSNHDKAGCLRIAWKRLRTPMLPGEDFSRTWDLFPLHRSGVVVPRRPGSLHPGGMLARRPSLVAEGGQNLPPGRRPPGNRCKPRQTGNGMELAVWEHGEAFSLAPLIASPLLEGIAGRHRSVAPTIESPEVQIMKVTKCPNCVAAGIDTEINATKTSAPIAPTDPTSSSRSAALLHQE